MAGGAVVVEQQCAGADISTGFKYHRVAGTRRIAAAGNPDWIKRASQELILQLRDDYPTLMEVLGALSDAIPGLQA